MKNVRLLLALAVVAVGAPPAGRAAGPGYAQAVETYYRGRMFTNAKKESIAYRLFVPPGIDAKKKYPVLLQLEGNGSQGNDLETPPWKRNPAFGLDQAAQAKNPCFIVTPRCRTGEMWMDVSRFGGDPRKTPSTKSLRLALEVLDAVTKEFKTIDPDRTYVAGFSMGGFGAWEIAIRNPDRFAAVVAVSGGGNPDAVKPIVRVPIWAFHGDADPVCPVEGTRRMVEALKKLGGSPKYTEYPKTQHGDALWKASQEKDLLPWIFAQRRGGRPAGKGTEQGMEKKDKDEKLPDPSEDPAAGLPPGGK